MRIINAALLDLISTDFGLSLELYHTYQLERLRCSMSPERTTESAAIGYCCTVRSCTARNLWRPERDAAAPRTLELSSASRYRPAHTPQRTWFNGPRCGSHAAHKRGIGSSESSRAHCRCAPVVSEP